MLRKRTRSQQKNQDMKNLMPNAIPDSYYQSDVFSQNHKNTSFLKVSGLFVGFNPRYSESDSSRSPTSPLDFRIFGDLSNPIWCPRVFQNEGYQKRWDSTKVGLSIIDSLDDETKQSGKVTRTSFNKNIFFGRKMSIRSPNIRSHVDSVEAPKSLPENLPVFPNRLSEPVNVQKGNSGVVFEIGEGPIGPEFNQTFRACSLDSGRFGSQSSRFGNRKWRMGSGDLVSPNPMPIEFGLLDGGFNLGNSCGEKSSSSPSSSHSGTRFIGSVPASEIQLSEDYTCVRTHGPNPKVTHIFGDCILECCNDDVPYKSKDDNAPDEGGEPMEYLASCPPSHFLKFCFSCHKKLDGEDIYVYRGEKSFCSSMCRSQEIETDEEIERSKSDSSVISEKSNSGLFIAI